MYLDAKYINSFLDQKILKNGLTTWCLTHESSEWWTLSAYLIKARNLKGQPGAWSSHFARVRGRVGPHWVIVRSLSLHFFCKRLFPQLEPVTSWSRRNSCITAPRLPFIKAKNLTKYFFPYLEVDLIYIFNNRRWVDIYFDGLMNMETENLSFSWTNL
jgi:hypothetical protein